MAMILLETPHLVAEGPSYNKFRVSEQLPHPKELQRPLSLATARKSDWFTPVVLSCI